jgi:hypothetical protein
MPTRKLAERTSESGQHLAGMVEVEQVHQGDIAARNQINFQISHEPAVRNDCRGLGVDISTLAG